MATPARTLAAPLAPRLNNSFGNLLHDIFTLYRRAIIRQTRAPAALYFSLVQPLIWFLLFGQLFSRITTGFGAAPTSGGQNPVAAQFGTTNYQAFFLPSIIIQMMLFGAAGSALGIINDDQTGYLNKLRVSPINRMAILLGGLLSDLTRMMVQVTILVVVGLLFGVQIQHWELLPVAFLIALLFGMMMGGLGLYVGLTTRSTQATFLVINFFTLPLLFTSSAQLPVKFLPEWLQTVSRFNPVTYAIDAMRIIITGPNIDQRLPNGDADLSVIGIGLLVLLVLAGLTLILATLKFRKQVQ